LEYSLHFFIVQIHHFFPLLGAFPIFLCSNSSVKNNRKKKTFPANLAWIQIDLVQLGLDFGVFVDQR